MSETKIRIDFQVLDVSDPYVLMLADTSKWAYASELPATLFITLPTRKNALHFQFPKGKDVVFNSHNLGVSCIKADCGEEDYVMLPDGVYKIKLQSKYKEHYKERLYLRTHKFNIKLHEMVIKMGEFHELTKCQKDKLQQIQYAMLRAKAYTSRGDEYRAAKYYHEAQELLEKAGCKSCSNGK